MKKIHWNDYVIRSAVLSVSQLMTVTDNIDVYYSLFDGKTVTHEGEVAQMVKRSLHIREVLGSIPRLSTSI